MLLVEQVQVDSLINLINDQRMLADPYLGQVSQAFTSSEIKRHLQDLALGSHLQEEMPLDLGLREVFLGSQLQEELPLDRDLLAVS